MANSSASETHADSSEMPASLMDRPKHIAIIMDGNGRWAQSRDLPRVEGHRRGVASVRRITEKCAREKLNSSRSIVCQAKIGVDRQWNSIFSCIFLNST